MTIAVLSESSSEYLRKLVSGISAFARGETNCCRLKWVNPDAPFSLGALEGCDGIIARIMDKAMARQLRRTGLPIADVNCQWICPGVFGVCCNNKKIGRLAATYLLSKRHVNFAFVGYEGITFSEDRKFAFLNALGECGMNAATYDIQLPHSTKSRTPITSRSNLSHNTLRRIGRFAASLPQPVAVFAANDFLAVNVLNAATAAGISVPDKMAILGVDDDNLFCAFAETPLSSIDPNPYGVGFAAARALAHAIRNPPTKENHSVLHIAPKGVVERESTMWHAIRPEWLADTLGHIDAMLSRPLSTSDIVEISGRSRMTVTNVFRSRLGKSPLEYITEVKMKAARKMLREGGMLVKEVAANVGYQCVPRFSVVYHEYWGHSPRVDIP